MNKLTPEQEAIARRTELRIEWEIRHPKSTKEIHEKVLAAVRDAIARALQTQSEDTARLKRNIAALREALRVHVTEGALTRTRANQLLADTYEPEAIDATTPDI